MRAQARSAVVAEVKVVTRSEVAAERVAARERRELAQEVTGEERALVLPLVEADRREQLGRTQAAAERRIERRQGLIIGGELKEKLITQARALRVRIGRELKRVKDWVRERFPEPLQQLKAQARDLFGTVTEKVPRTHLRRNQWLRSRPSAATMAGPPEISLEPRGTRPGAACGGTMGRVPPAAVT